MKSHLGRLNIFDSSEQRDGRATLNLSERTTFRTGGWTREAHTPSNEAELQSVLAQLARRGHTPFILGGGANTLFPDGEYGRPVVLTDRLDRLEFDGDSLVAGAGVRLNKLIQRAIAGGLAGLEVFVGIPGTCGGAVTMNAGGGGHAFGDLVSELGVVALDGSGSEVLRGRDVRWAYRTSNLNGYVVSWARLELSSSTRDALRQRAGDIMRRKAATQPISAASAGCIFRNPPGASAGELIERFGLKGLRCGGAQVSPRHANFIVNAGGASASDVRELVRQVSATVEESCGVRLETELVLA